MFDSELYNTSEFKKILSHVYDLREIQIFKEKKMNSLSPFFISNKWLKHDTIFNMPFNFYYSPILNSMETEFFKGLHDFSHKKKINIILKSLRIYGSQNAISYEKNSYLRLSYANYSDYFNSLSKNFRQNIRTAYNKLNKEFKFKKIDNIGDLKQIHRIMSILYIDKHKMVFQPYQLFEKLYMKDFADFYVYKDINSNTVLAAIIVCKDNLTCHYSWGITNPKYYKFSLNTLLVNELIKIGYEEKMKFIDFGATPNSDKKLLFFKDKWGCEHYPVYYYYTLKKPIEMDLNNSLLFARNIYSKMPKTIIRSIMPRIVPWLVS